MYEDEPLLVQGDASDELMLVLSGTPVVRRGGEVVANLWSGQFAGEMAFATQAPATATVSPDGKPVCCRVWSTTRLRGLFHTSPELAVAFEQAVSVDVISKLETSQLARRGSARARC